MRVTPLVFVFAVGCGRLGFEGSDPIDPPPDDPMVPPSSMKTVPEVCASQAWTIAAVDPDLAIAPSGGGAAVFFVPKAGGAISGFVLDASLTQTTPPKLVVAGNFSAAGANYVDGSMVLAGVNGNRTLVHLVDDTLAPTEIANVDGLFVSEGSVAHVNGARFTPTSCSAGLMVNPFDGSWNSQPTDYSTSTDESTGLDTTAFGAEALSVFSTMTSCHVVRHTSRSQGVDTAVATSCAAPRIAATDTAGRLAYEESGNVVLEDFANDAFGAKSTLAAGTSPRILYDGTRYWISYLDPEGDLTIGFIDEMGGFASTELAGTTPSHDGYEIAMIGGKLWQVSMTGTDAIANQICLVTR